MENQRDTIINITNNIDVESDTSTTSNPNSIKSFFTKILKSPLFEKILYFISFFAGGGFTSAMLINSNK